MPPRSNDFQRLIYLVKKVLAGTSATVTESKMLRDLQTGDEREVDVCVEAEVAGDPVMICFECRDHGRPADVTWVEQMKSKHERLPTGTLVLASRSGFSKRAISLAKVAGIQRLTFNGASEQDIAAAVDLNKTLWALVYSLDVMKVAAVVPAVHDLPEERVALNATNLCYTGRGDQTAEVKDAIAVFMRSEAFAEKVRQEGTESHRSFTLEVGNPTFDGQERIFIQKIEPRVLRRVEKLIISRRLPNPARAVSAHTRLSRPSARCLGVQCPRRQECDVTGDPEGRRRGNPHATHR